jgi:hypothetical protein
MPNDNNHLLGVLQSHYSSASVARFDAPDLIYAVDQKLVCFMMLTSSVIRVYCDAHV